MHANLEFLPSHDEVVSWQAQSPLLYHIERREQKLQATAMEGLGTSRRAATQPSAVAVMLRLGALRRHAGRRTGPAKQL